MNDDSPGTRAVDKPKRKKAANGAGTLERRGALWYVQVLRPLVSGEKKRRRARLPIKDSEAMSEAQARRASKKTLADWRTGKLVFAATQGPPPALGPAGDWRTVRQLGDAWTGKADRHGRVASTPMLDRFGKVNKLRLEAGAAIDRWTLEANAYDTKTRGEAGPAFGELDVAAVTSDDVAMASQAMTW
jgi:hypothetical protein